MIGGSLSARRQPSTPDRSIDGLAKGATPNLLCRRMTTKTRIVRIQATRRPRAGWADAARAMSAAGHDDLLDEPSATRFDREEWEWR